MRARARRAARVRLGSCSRVGVSYRDLVLTPHWSPQLCEAAAQRVGVDGSMIVGKVGVDMDIDEAYLKLRAMSDGAALLRERH